MKFSMIIDTVNTIFDFEKNILYAIIVNKNIRGTIMFTIITFNEIYRDDAIFCLISAKDALGNVPQLNSDILNI